MRFVHFAVTPVAVALLSLTLAACNMGPGNNKVNGSVDVAAGTSVADASAVNGSIHVAANARAGDASAVNGSVHVASGAHVADATTVNGDIALGENTTANEATTVNGSIALAHGAKVAGDVTSVNGTLDLADGAAVGGALTNVNGGITVDGAQISHGITTVNGDISITGHAVVNGGIKVHKSKSGFLGIHFGSGNKHEPRIVIGPGATVNGALDFERKVDLYISDQAHVAGPISGATAVKFSGAQPPGS